MKCSLRTRSYHPGRWGRPWLAVWDFDHEGNPAGEPRWANHIGVAGRPGRLVFDAEPCDVIMRGQKLRGRGVQPRPKWGVVEPDGRIKWATSRWEAFRISTMNRNAMVESL